MSKYHTGATYIAFEGIDGCGKSTMIEEIASLLRRTGYDVAVVHEPGTTPMAADIRKLAKSPEYTETITPITEMLLMSAARSQLLENIVRPALAANKIVLSDRSYLSTLAYQGTDYVNLEHCITLTELVVNDTKPDLIIYMDVDPKVGLERAGNRAALDRIESKGCEYFNKVRRRFKQLAIDYANVTEINASGTRAENFVQCWGLVSQLLASRETVDLTKEVPHV